MMLFKGEINCEGTEKFIVAGAGGERLAVFLRNLKLLYNVRETSIRKALLYA